MINSDDRRMGIYVHIPFCVAKCRYCDFLSVPAGKEEVLKYLTVLRKEIAERAKEFGDIRVESVFFGGGTPSILGTAQIGSVFMQLREAFLFDPEAEISIEVNPGTVNREKLQFYREIGINRLSIGLQSAVDAELEVLGRIHTFREFLTTFKSAREAGFRNINIDLMSALPGQTMESYEYTLQKVTELEPEHISAYSLIIEEGTPFFEMFGGNGSKNTNAGLVLPDEDMEREMYELTKQYLEKQGYIRYEISNYAKNGYLCRHNEGYWKRRNYLGLGLGAASMVENKRWKNSSVFGDYEQGSFIKEQEQMLSQEERMEEFMFLGLRLMKGVSEKDFLACFGKRIEDIYGSQIADLMRKGLLKKEKGEYYSLSERGIDLSNRVMAEFLF